MDQYKHWPESAAIIDVSRQWLNSLEDALGVNSMDPLWIR